MLRRVLCGGLLTLLSVGSVLAEERFPPAPITKGVLLVASPSLSDANFDHTVLLIIKHGPEGTLGLVLNRSTNVRLSQVLPNLTVLNGTNHRLFVGGPVEPARLLLLFRSKVPLADARPILDGLYVGGTPGLLERVFTEAQTTGVFRAFGGYAGWAPGQLEFEMLQGSWGVLPLEGVDILGKDPASLWPDSVARLQTPRVISH
jgi:putative transcriptional regulator